MYTCALRRIATTHTLLSTSILPTSTFISPLSLRTDRATSVPPFARNRLFVRSASSSESQGGSLQSSGYADISSDVPLTEERRDLLEEPLKPVTSEDHPSPPAQAESMETYPTESADSANEPLEDIDWKSPSTSLEASEGHALERLRLIMDSQKAGSQSTETDSPLEDYIDGEPEPIPPLPQPISNDIIAAADYQTYILPLFTRWWKFRIAKTTRLFEGVRLRFPEFCRTYMFKNNETALDFIRDCGPLLTDYTDARPADGNYPGINIRGMHLEFKLHTKRAIHPLRRKHDSERPGITIHDIILAVRLETLFENDYVPSGRGVPSTGIPNPENTRVLRPPSLELLSDRLKNSRQEQDEDEELAESRPQKLARITKLLYSQRKPICVCCGGRHHVRFCTTRHTRRPPSLCPNCSGDHWVFDCPDLSQHNMTGHSSSDMQSEKRSPVCACCGGPHNLRNCAFRMEKPPPSPCSNCGEDHWRMDCPKPLQTTQIGRVKKQSLPPSNCPYCGGNHWKSNCEEFKNRTMSRIGIPLLPVS